MNYKSIYDNLITKAKNRILWVLYYEKHHIIPKSMEGSNDIENIVSLTAKEHIIAHHLLAKIRELPRA